MHQHDLLADGADDLTGDELALVAGQPRHDWRRTRRVHGVELALGDFIGFDDLRRVRHRAGDARRTRGADGVDRDTELVQLE